MKLLKTREKIVDLIRQFFKKEGFTEVETPLLVPYPDPSPFNEVFETSREYGYRAFLTPSPEFFMKKLICQNKSSIFQICKAFRWSKETDPLHNPEFTILEWYRVGADYLDIMNDCENLLNFINQTLKSLIPLTSPWLRIPVKEAFAKYAEVDLDKFLEIKRAKEICRQKGYQVNKNYTWEVLYHQIFLNEIEPRLPKDIPVILYDYPAPLAALAKLKVKDPRYAERFELYLNGLEIANAYSELTDWKEQEKRLKADIAERRRLKMKVFDYDRDFVAALKKGMPRTGGIALGVDRLIMLLTGAKSIQEVISFPFCAKI